MYEIKQNAGGLRAEFSASYEAVDRVCSALKDFLAEHKFESISFDVLLGVREVLTNAVRHGSNIDDNLVVSCAISLRPESLVVEVADQGPGFDWRVTEERCPIDPDALNGRGLWILRKYFDSHSYNEKGNKVLLVKHLRPNEK